MQDLKARGKTVILITHRTSIINSVDKLLVVREGEWPRMACVTVCWST